MISSDHHQRLTQYLLQSRYGQKSFIFKAQAKDCGPEAKVMTEDLELRARDGLSGLEVMSWPQGLHRCLVLNTVYNVLVGVMVLK